MTTTPVARPDYEAHVRATRATFPEVAHELRDILGAKLCAYLGSVRETRAVHQWADGSREPGAGVQRRLRVALHVGRSHRGSGRAGRDAGVVSGAQPAARGSVTGAPAARG